MNQQYQTDEIDERELEFVAGGRMMSASVVAQPEPVATRTATLRLEAASLVRLAY